MVEYMRDFVSKIPQKHYNDDTASRLKHIDIAVIIKIELSKVQRTVKNQ